MPWIKARPSNATSTNADGAGAFACLRPLTRVSTNQGSQNTRVYRPPSSAVDVWVSSADEKSE